MRSILKNAALVIASMIFAVVLVEVFLHVLAFVAPRTSARIVGTEAVPDAEIFYKPDPTDPDHDDNGFRNRSIPRTATIVALGDSHTYGYGVVRAQAWPQLLGALAGVPIYNMGVGGYSPVNSLMLWPLVAALRPKVVIEAVFLGNDLFESFELLYYNLSDEFQTHRHEGRLSGLKSSDAETVRKIKEAEDLVSGSEKATKANFQQRWRKYLSKNSRVYALLRQIKRRYEGAHGGLPDGSLHGRLYWQWIKLNLLSMKGTYIFDTPELRTVFAPSNRLVLIDKDDPIVEEGYNIALSAIRRLSEESKKIQATFVVLLIPTKELVFEKIIEKHGHQIPREHAAVIRNEKLYLKKFKAFAEQEGILVLDALPSLQQCLSKGIQPYSVTWDSHPNYVGQRVIAEYVWSELQDRNLLAEPSLARSRLIESFSR